MHIDVETIYKDISKLSVNEKKTVLSKLMNELVLVLNKKNKRSIKELKGLGKDVWNNTDAQDYVRSERSSWN